MEANRRLMFGDFCLDLTAEQLLEGGEVVALTPKAFAVLRRLVEDGGHLVSKEELLRAGWGKTHVSDGVLKVIILEIRRALGDDPAAPSFIETVPRRGYRFVAPRTRAATAPPAGAPAPLVGRDGVLARLEEHLKYARDGQRRLVFLSGEAGIGKTTVLDAFLARAGADPDLMIASGTCLEHYGTAEAYFPVLEALGRLLREPGADRMIALLASRAPTWLVQLPWIEPPGDREALRRDLLGVTNERMLREMGEALEALTAKTPFILVLEDLHWSDRATLDLLGMLGRRQEQAQLLVIGTYRSADVIVGGHPLRAAIQELRARRQCEDIELPFLGEGDIGAYLAQRFGAETSSRDLASAVHRATDGNPLFMVRLADELVALGVLAQEAGYWCLRGRLDDVTRTVPESLRALIDKQVARLEPDVQRMLEVAGLLGNQFTAAAIAAGLAEDPIVVEERCDALSRQRQLVVPETLMMLPDGTPIAQYAFTHNLYPQVLGARVAGARRVRLHQRIGEWLEQTFSAHPGAISTQLAWHFEEGRDYPRAIRYLILSAENAARRSAHRDAIRILQRALALAANVAASIRPELEIEILERIGDAYYWLGAMSEGVAAYEAEAARAADAGLTHARVRALSWLVRPFGLIDPDRGIAAVEQAAKLSADCDDPLLQACTELLAGSTRLFYDRWRTEDWNLCASARNRIDGLSPVGLPPYYRMVFAHLQVLQGNYGQALRNLEAGVPTVTEPGSMMVYFWALSGKTVGLLLSGQWGELVRVLQEGKDSAEKNGNDPWLFLFREAWLRTVVLDFDGARRVCEAVVRAPTAYPTGQPQTIARLATAYAALEHDEHDEALRLFAEVLDAETTPKFFLHWYWRMQAQLGRSNAWLAAGNPSSARGEADRFLESALSTAEPNLQALAWEVEARVALAAKDRQTAEAHLARAFALLERFEIPTTAWRVHATASEVYRYAKDGAAAETHRSRAEAIIFALADSFAPDEPLRNTFLESAPIRRIRRRRGSRRGGAREPMR